MPINMTLIGIAAIIIIVVVAVAVIYNSPAISTTTTINSGPNYTTSISPPSTTVQSTSTVPVQNYTLNLTDCNVGIRNQQVVLGCNYTSSINIDSWHEPNTSFTGPSGNLTYLYNNDGNGFFFENNRVTLFMADYYQTPLPGTYTVVISYQNQLLVKKNLTFTAANISVVDARPKTFTDSYIPNPNHNGDEKYLGVINVTVQNSGDLPAYIGTTEVNITGPVSHDIGDSYTYWMAAHAFYTSPSASPYAYPSGGYTLSVDLLNYSGASVVAASFPVSVP